MKQAGQSQESLPEYECDKHGKTWGWLYWRPPFRSTFVGCGPCYIEYLKACNPEESPDTIEQGSR